MDLIIGGGITGLSYAYYCGTDEYLVLEKENEIGGYCRTIRRNGFVWDYSGHFFHFQNPEIQKLLLSGMNKMELIEVIKMTCIRYKDLYIDYPFQKNIHQLPKEELIECLYDLFVQDQTTSNNFKEMVCQKFGTSIAEKFLIPYNEKLYACDLNTLDKDAMGRFFPYAEKEEIIRNFRKEKDFSYNNTFLYSQGGAIEYICSLEKRLNKKNILRNADVIQISLKDKYVRLRSGEKIIYDRLISTMPFPQLLNMADIKYDKFLYSWNQVLVFNLGFNKKGQEKEKQWIYFPEKNYCFYRVGFYDNILNQNRMSLYVELGFDKGKNIQTSEWLGQVMNDLRKAGLITEGQVLLDYEAVVMNPAYVHINNASIRDVNEKKAYLETMGVYSIGRYGGWSYCSIEDNIVEAKRLANKINI